MTKPVVEIAGKVVYSLQEKQLEALNATPLRGGAASHIGYGGAAGGGKSHLARVVATLAALEWPGSTSIIFRRTSAEVERNHMLPFRAEVPDGGGDVYTLNESKKVATWWNGSRTLFGWLQYDKDVFDYQGDSYDLMVFEEATHLSWFQVSWLTGNRLRASVDGTVPFALYPSNPGNIGQFWYKRLFIDRNFRAEEQPEDYTFVQSRLSDNRILMERDPKYIERLNKLPEPLRSQLRDGDWSAGAGLALPGLKRDVHMVPAFEPPDHWFFWNAYDHGFNHPFVFGHFCADEDGNAYLVDTVTGRHLLDHEIIERIRERKTIRLDLAKMTHAGHDAWNEYRARGEATPTTAERFAQAGIVMRKANTSRISGLQNMRHYIAANPKPRFYVMDTPSNQMAFACLEAMVVDPDSPEDALKVDADDFGDGGDDPYDMVRYGLAGRPLAGDAPPVEPLPTQDYDRRYAEVIERMQTNRKARRGF